MKMKIQAINKQTGKKELKELDIISFSDFDDSELAETHELCRLTVLCNLFPELSQEIDEFNEAVISSQFIYHAPFYLIKERLPKLIKDAKKGIFATWYNLDRFWS